MFGTKIRIEKELFNKIKMYSEIAGYSSVEEFVSHALQKAITKLEDVESEEEIRKTMKGLGYIS